MDKTSSVPVEGKHSTAPQGKSYKETNVTAIALNWENQEMWLITAYFPNDLKGTKATVQAQYKTLCRFETKRLILTGDFNSTKSTSTFDVGGARSHSGSKKRNAEAIQNLLSEWRFKDATNEASDQERNSLEHLTH
jgi:hypothetical protein